MFATRYMFQMFAPKDMLRGARVLNNFFQVFARSVAHCAVLLECVSDSIQLTQFESLRLIQFDTLIRFTSI